MNVKIPTLDENGKPEKVNGNDYVLLAPTLVQNNKGLQTEDVKVAEYLGRYLAGLDIGDFREKDKIAMTTTQIRNFFGEIRKIQMKTVGNSGSDFAMLKPRMAIARVRATKDKPNNRIKKFEEVVVHLFDNIEKQEDKQDQQFQNFADFIEAVVAYHKANGGKN
jgi:CRISPR-associated protein Csm2